MSCISQILSHREADGYIRMKGKEGGIRLIIEDGGEYRGHEYLVVFTDMGHRCGYVAIPSGSKLDEPTVKGNVGFIGEDDIGVHGGITFSDREHFAKEYFGIACNDLWLGFDCAHGFDGKDLDLVRKLYGDDNETIKFYDQYPQYRINHEYEHVRELDFVISECKKMIDQLIELEQAA